MRSLYSVERRKKQKQVPHFDFKDKAVVVFAFTASPKTASTCHGLSVYVPGMVLSTVHGLAHLILLTILS